MLQRPVTRGAQMRRIFRDCPEAEKKEIPNELLADHYSSTLFLVRQWITLREGGCSRERAHGYLKLPINWANKLECLILRLKADIAHVKESYFSVSLV